jgi:serine phosphatase RsbU (regulator of sigma subunit)
MRPGPLLGADRAATYPTTEVALPPGSVLALYTDGLIEAPGTDLETNLTRLATVLAEAGERPEDIADALVRQANPSEERTDDTALLLLCVTAEEDAGGRGGRS